MIAKALSVHSVGYGYRIGYAGNAGNAFVVKKSGEPDLATIYPQMERLKKCTNSQYSCGV